MTSRLKLKPPTRTPSSVTVPRSLRYDKETRRRAAQLNISIKRKQGEKPDLRIIEMAYENMWHTPLPHERYFSECSKCGYKIADHPDDLAWEESNFIREE